MSIRVVIADDRKIVREGLHSLLRGQNGIEVVAEAENGREALQLARELAPDVVVMDVTMPDMNGIDATHQIKAENPDIKVIALSIHSNQRLVAEMLSSGASGYVLKDCAFEELVTAIHRAAENRSYITPAITDQVIEDYVAHLARTNSVDVPAPLLTPREREVLQLLSEGKSAKEIARHLHVSVKTVETHRGHVMEKLGAHSLAILTKYAVREGLTSLDF